MSSSAPEPEPHVVEDCRGVLQVMSDGTVRRSTEAEVAALFPVHIPDGDCGVEWKDVTWDRDHGLNARLYRPRHRHPPGARRLPVVAYFHGGGFCLGSGRWPKFHAWCLRLSSELPAVVLSFDYRLAPEHRLPAAQEDGARAMSWLRSAAAAAADPWLADDAAADFARVFVAGDSAGGNIAHHVAAGDGASGRIRGAVLLVPAFAGEARTRSEQECPRDASITPEIGESYSRLALPAGATMDHPVLNPAGPRAPALEAVEMAPVLVVAGGRDMLRDRNAQYARRMKEDWRKEVEYVEVAGADHGFFLRDQWSESADEVVRVVRRFVVEHMDSA